jgi:ubiquinone/menaquinone biosynthesis C-methylase UbiE
LFAEMSFDSLAPTYDHDFTTRPIAAVLRQQTRERMARHFKPGMHILELGCGTGEDARWLSENGIYVHATDPSAEMRRISVQKLASFPDSGVSSLDVNSLPTDTFLKHFDGVLSNFGALNMTRDWAALGLWLARRIRPGGMVCMAVMSRFCLWESAAALFKGRPKHATRRWSGKALASLPDSGSLTISYPAPGEIQRAWAPSFELTWRAGLGTFLPPSEFFGMLERRPKLLARLTRWEQSAWKRGLGHFFADHVWLEFRRKHD